MTLMFGSGPLIYNLSMVLRYVRPIRELESQEWIIQRRRHANGAFREIAFLSCIPVNASPKEMSGDFVVYTLKCVETPKGVPKEGLYKWSCSPTRALKEGWR